MLGRGQPGPALHWRNKQAVVKMALATELSLRGRFAPVAISGRQLRFRREYSVIQPGSARFPRRFAPRNDKPGDLTP